MHQLKSYRVYFSSIFYYHKTLEQNFTKFQTFKHYTKHITNLYKLFHSKLLFMQKITIYIYQKLRDLKKFFIMSFYSLTKQKVNIKQKQTTVLLMF